MRKWPVVCAIRKSDVVGAVGDAKAKMMPWAGGEGSRGMFCYRSMCDIWCMYKTGTTIRSNQNGF